MQHYSSMITIIYHNYYKNMNKSKLLIVILIFCCRGQENLCFTHKKGRNYKKLLPLCLCGILGIELKAASFGLFCFGTLFFDVFLLFLAAVHFLFELDNADKLLCVLLDFGRALGDKVSTCFCEQIHIAVAPGNAD